MWAYVAAGVVLLFFGFWSLIALALAIEIWPVTLGLYIAFLYRRRRKRTMEECCKHPCNVV